MLIFWRQTSPYFSNSVYTSLVPTHFSVSDQLVSSDIFPAHGSGSREETAQEGDGGERTK
jgi:hypothetical protein